MESAHRKPRPSDDPSDPARRSTATGVAQPRPAKPISPGAAALVELVVDVLAAGVWLAGVVAIGATVYVVVKLAAAGFGALLGGG